MYRQVINSQGVITTVECCSIIRLIVSIELKQKRISSTIRNLSVFSTGEGIVEVSYHESPFDRFQMRFSFLISNSQACTYYYYTYYSLATFHKRQ